MKNKHHSGLYLRLFFALLFALFLGSLSGLDTWAARKPSLNAKSAVVMDMETGKILYGKNPYQRRNQASLTKLMTVTLALEANKPSQKVTIPHRAAIVKFSHFPLLTGDVFYVRDLGYGAMLPSSNGCCTALALKTSGSLGKFVGRMNRKAKELGCKKTHYVNTHGLPIGNHYSCAYDTALILRYAYSNANVRKYMSTKSRTFRTLKKRRRIRLRNTNKLLGSYKGVICGKTGTTRMAGFCLATVYQYKEKDYAVVVLGCRSEKMRQNDSKKLYRYVRSIR